VEEARSPRRGRTARDPGRSIFMTIALRVAKPLDATRPGGRKTFFYVLKRCFFIYFLARGRTAVKAFFPLLSKGFDKNRTEVERNSMSQKNSAL
jgi:hypothetical protein